MYLLVEKCYLIDDRFLTHRMCYCFLEMRKEIKIWIEQSWVSLILEEIFVFKEKHHKNLAHVRIGEVVNVVSLVKVSSVCVLPEIPRIVKSFPFFSFLLPFFLSHFPSLFLLSSFFPSILDLSAFGKFNNINGKIIDVHHLQLRKHVTVNSHLIRSLCGLLNLFSDEIQVSGLN